MGVTEPHVFVGELTTVGRRTGRPRTVELRLVRLNGKFYASSSNVERKHWCRNMMKNPEVSVAARGERFLCFARRLDDKELRRKILTLRDSPPLMERVVFELAPVK
jgi:deazaflavin-dependent oxidoreductase (nitroreductase family)